MLPYFSKILKIWL